MDLETVEELSSSTESEETPFPDKAQEVVIATTPNGVLKERLRGKCAVCQKCQYVRSGRSMFNFPKDPQMLSEWCEILNINLKDTKDKHIKICEDHFESDVMFTMKSNGKEFNRLYSYAKPKRVLPIAINTIHESLQTKDEIINEYEKKIKDLEKLIIEKTHSNEQLQRTERELEEVQKKLKVTDAIINENKLYCKCDKDDDVIFIDEFNEINYMDDKVVKEKTEKLHQQFREKFQHLFDTDRFITSIYDFLTISDANKLKAHIISLKKQYNKWSKSKQMYFKDFKQEETKLKSMRKHLEIMDQNEKYLVNFLLRAAETNANNIPPRIKTSLKIRLKKHGVIINFPKQKKEKFINETITLNDEENNDVADGENNDAADEENNNAADEENNDALTTESKEKNFEKKLSRSDEQDEIKSINDDSEDIDQKFIISSGSTLNYIKVKDGYQCEKCFKIFQKIFQYKSHMNSHEEQSLICFNCGHLSETSVEAKKHHKQLRSKGLCPNEINSTTKSYQKQLKPMYTCEICNDVFGAQSDYIEHCKIKHNNDRPFCCPICQRTFPHYRLLADHKRRHMNKNKLYKCNICNDDKLYSYRLYNIHNKMQHVKHFECVPCTKSFQSLNDLKTHKILVHKYSKIQWNRKTCNLCPKVFTTTEQFLNHFAFADHKKLESNWMKKFNIKSFDCCYCKSASYKQFHLFFQHISKVHNRNTLTNKNINAFTYFENKYNKNISEQEVNMEEDPNCDDDKEMNVIDDYENILEEEYLIDESENSSNDEQHLEDNFKEMLENV